MFKITKQLFLGGNPVVIEKYKTKKEAEKRVEILSKKSDIYTLYNIIKN